MISFHKNNLICVDIYIHLYLYIFTSIYIDRYTYLYMFYNIGKIKCTTLHVSKYGFSVSIIFYKMQII